MMAEPNLHLLGTYALIKATKTKHKRKKKVFFSERVQIKMIPNEESPIIPNELWFTDNEVAMFKRESNTEVRDFMVFNGISDIRVAMEALYQPQPQSEIAYEKCTKWYWKLYKFLRKMFRFSK